MRIMLYKRFSPNFMMALLVAIIHVAIILGLKLENLEGIDVEQLCGDAVKNYKSENMQLKAEINNLRGGIELNGKH